MIKKTNIGWLSLAAILISGYFLFGFTGIRTITGIIILFFVPAYLILDNFNIEKEEKIFFSFFIGLGIFPLVVFYLNRVIPSLRITLVVSVILLSALGIFMKRHKKRIRKNKENN